jgi:hypothetical protein
MVAEFSVVVVEEMILNHKTLRRHVSEDLKLTSYFFYVHRKQKKQEDAT